MMVKVLCKAGEYFKRSFFAIDGLWFLEIEKQYSFDEALELDEKVWWIMPKIQSRKIRELYDIKGDSLTDLVEALKIKFTFEGYKIHIKKIRDDYIQILVTECPWFNIMKRADREVLAGKVGERICSVEYRSWADSFNTQIVFTLTSQLCKGETMCQFNFKIHDSK